ncbi:hypothetical protein TNCV_1363341 [Trichonephila clavipes]|uniref:Uncharacterized protein n=1 Tax=Trichonephila clavipes TaxID=2585209 RepID=A0A8X6RXE0_TRICX|nr:hypothetical protein TNCV_1363341 [Trichonephila clavipes]
MGVKLEAYSPIAPFFPLIPSCIGLPSCPTQGQTITCVVATNGIFQLLDLFCGILESAKSVPATVSVFVVLVDPSRKIRLHHRS